MAADSAGYFVFPDFDPVALHLGPVMMPKMMDAVTKKTQQGAE